MAWVWKPFRISTGNQQKPKNCKTKSSDIFSLEISTFHKSNSKDNRIKKYNNMGMDQYLLIPFLVG